MQYRSNTVYIINMLHHRFLFELSHPNHDLFSGFLTEGKTAHVHSYHPFPQRKTQAKLSTTTSFSPAPVPSMAAFLSASSNPAPTRSHTRQHLFTPNYKNAPKLNGRPQRRRQHFGLFPSGCYDLFLSRNKMPSKSFG